MIAKKALKKGIDIALSEAMKSKRVVFNGFRRKTTHLKRTHGQSWSLSLYDTRRTNGRAEGETVEDERNLSD